VRQTNPASWAAKAFALVALTFASGWGGALQGQVVTPTQEGTEIVNFATATFEDVNGNDYDATSDTSTVTVGFDAGITVAAPVDQLVPAGSTDNEAVFTICMTGNASEANEDWFVVSEPVVGSELTVTGYLLNGTVNPDTNEPYTLAELNAKLEADRQTAYDLGNDENCITVTVIYDASGANGTFVDNEIELTATSGRDPATSDDDFMLVSSELTGTISVTPDTPELDAYQDVYRGSDPDNNNLLVYTLTNDQGGTDDFTVVASLSAELLAAGYSISSIVCLDADGGGLETVVIGDTTTCSGLAAGESYTIEVLLNVPLNAPEGATAEVVLTATSQTVPATTDTGDYLVTVIMPVLSMTKVAYSDNNQTAIGAPVPGDYIWYLITVTNSGSATASNIVVSDVLPSQVTFISAAGVDGIWTSIVHDGAVPAGPATTAGGTVTATLDGPLSVGSSSVSFWIQVQIN